MKYGVKITVLTYLEGADDVPDAVVDQVAQALRDGGHAVSVLAIHDDVDALIAGLREAKPVLVFNLMEMFGEDVRGDVSVAGVLEVLGIPFTGGGAGELYLTQDKALAKKILKFEGIRYPDFAVFYQDADLETGGNLRMPLFVKPMRLDASIGIDAKSLVQSSTDLMKRVIWIHEECNDAALAEEYIEGREFYVAILGNRQPTALPIVEMDFSAMKEGTAHVLDQKAKWDMRSEEYQAARPAMADLPDELRARMQKVSLDAYRALKCRDYGRVDLRLTESNEIYVIEVNANCYLEKNDEFARAARAGGIEFTELVNRIARLAIERNEQERGNGRARTVPGSESADDADPGSEARDPGDEARADTR